MVLLYDCGEAENCASYASNREILRKVATNEATMMTFRDCSAS